MTLIISHAFSAGFVCVTSDTMFRQLELAGAYDPDTEIVGKAMDIDKTKLLTDNIIVSEGGLTLMTGAILQKLEEKVEKDMYLDDCLSLLHEVWDEMQEQFSEDPFFIGNKDTPYYSVRLDGFYSNKQTGQITLSGNKIKETKCETETSESTTMVNMFVPTEDMLEITKGLKEGIYNAESFESLFEQYKNIHALVAATHPEMVSKTIKMLWLQNVGDEIISETVTMDLSEKVESFKNALESIKQDQ